MCVVLYVCGWLVKEFGCPYASCSDCCIVLCWSWSVVMVVVVVFECCCCIPYQLALMLVLTFAPCVLTFAPCVLTVAPSVLTFVPCTLTFASCTGGAIFLSTSASTPLAHMVVVSGNLRWWSFSFQPLAHILLHLRLTNLHCVVVVVVCGGGSCVWMWRWWYVCIYISVA